MAQSRQDALDKEGIIRSKQRTPFKVSVSGPSTGLNTRLPQIGSGALASYGAYSSSAANLGSMASLRDATACTNMRFEDGVACNSPGYIPVEMIPTPDGPINLIGQTNLNSEIATISTRSPIIGTTKSLYAQIGTSGYLTVFAVSDKIIYDSSTTMLTASFVDTFGDGSNIPDFLWTQLSGPIANITSDSAQSTGITGLTPGIYVFQIKAIDGTSSTVASIKISVFAKDIPFTIPSFIGASFVAAHPITGLIYVAQNFSQSSGHPSIVARGLIIVYDPFNRTIISVITPPTEIQSSSSNGFIKYNPSDGYMYYGYVFQDNTNSTQSHYLFKIDTATNTIISSTSLIAKSTQEGSQPQFCFISDTVAVMAALNGVIGFFQVLTFYTIDLKSMTITASIACGGTTNQFVCGGITFNPVENKIYAVAGYAPAYFGNGMVIYDISAGSASFGSGSIPAVWQGIDYCPIDNRIYVSGSNGFGIIDDITGAFTPIIDSTSSPFNQCIGSNWNSILGKIYFISQNLGISSNTSWLRSYSPQTESLNDLFYDTGRSLFSSPPDAANFDYSFITNSFYVPTSNSIGMAEFNSP